MAKQDVADINVKAEKKKLNDEKKKLKEEQKQQHKEAKKKAKEIALQQASLGEDEEGSSISVFFVTAFIVIIWLAILALLIKLDVGGFGSGVLTPVLKDVPVINKILPGDKVTETVEEEGYGGYSSLREAVEQINYLSQQLEQVQSSDLTKSEEIAELKAEVLRLKEFEDKQVEFQRIKNQFYEEVIYAENGPGAEEYRAYYEEMDPTTAENLYKQVVTQLEETAEVKDYASAYSAMKPKEAAAIFEEMKNDLNLAARILKIMSAEDRGKILGVMDSEIAAKLTKIMDPES